MFKQFSLIAFFCVLAGTVNAQVDNIDIPYTKFTLDNGLTLLVHEDHKAPIVAVNIWYHVGSKDEKPGRTGFAHLFEHLMFNGSENYNDEWFKATQEVGATDMNGTTWFDRTNYFQNVPVGALDRILWMESDRMGHMLGAVTQERLDEQRGVVQNEKRQGDNQPYRKAQYLQLEGMFPEGHPYRWSTIGSMEDLSAASLEDVHEWFKTWYGAANAVLVIAGDVTPETALEKVQHYFGDIPPGPALQHQKTWVAKRSESSRKVMEDDVAQARVSLLWNTAEFGSEENVYLSLAADILGSGKNSRLYKRLVYKDRSATSASAAQSAFEIAGMFELEALVKPGTDPAQAEAALREELQQFLDKGPSKEELQRVITSNYANIVRGLESVGGFSGKAQLLARNETYLGDAAAYKKDLQWMTEATPKLVRNAARKWLNTGDLTITIVPQGTHSVAENGADRSQMPGTGSMANLSFPEVTRFNLDNGIEVYLAERDAIPVINMKMLFDAGYAADNQQTLGNAAFTMEMLDEGSKGYSALELAEELEKLGASLNSGSSLDSSFVLLSALKTNLADSIELWSTVIQSPSFDEMEIARVRSNWMDRIAQEKTNPVATALRILPPLLYGESHPYGIPFTGSGTEDSINRLTQEDMRNFHTRWIRSDNAKLVIVGDTSAQEIKPLLNKTIGKWQSPAEKAPAKQVANVTDAQQMKIYLVNKPGAPQSMIIGGQLLPATGDDNTVVTNMATTILGGSFTARLNMNLREDKGWAYGARVIAQDAAAQRPMLYYAPVQTDKTVPALQEILREGREYITSNPAKQSELDLYRAGILRGLPGQYETTGAVLNAMANNLVFERPINYVETYQQEVAALTVESIQQAAKTHINPEITTWVIVGDLAKIEAPIRDLGITTEVIEL